MIWLPALTLLLTPSKLPPGPEKRLVERVCGSCHDPDVVVGMVNSREGWSDLVNEMMTRGGAATEAQKKQIVRYLFRNYPQRSEPR